MGDSRPGRPGPGPAQLLALLALMALAAYQSALVDLLAALLLLSLVAGGNHHRGRYLAGALGLSLALVFLGDTADRALRYFFARPLDLQYDVFLLPALWDLLRDTSGVLAATAAAVLLLVLLVALGRCYAWLLREAAAGLVAGAPLAILCLASAATAALIPPDLLTRYARSAALVEGLYQAAVVSDDDELFERELLIARARAQSLPADLAGLSGQDFILFFVESYGRLLWDDPALRPDFQETLRRVEDELGGAGYRIASRFLRSPTFGGASWLAHMSVMSGVDCANQTRWERLLASDIPPLPVYFRNRGYETVSVMPAMWIDSWPEGEYFGFDRHVWARELDYRGPKYAWSPMPDQFVLLRFQELALGEEAGPLFAELALTSSHSPFTVRPAFHRGDWQRDALEATLATVDPERIPWSWYDLRAGEYLLAVTYSLRSVGQFLARQYPRAGTHVILGDHQATKAIHRVDSEALGHIRDVPMHVVTRDEALHQIGRAHV